ncbi:hypothetical protein T4D_1383 [Trichinella pseudospiralis]|uniref:Uncharacterized protein n=1 Tax=Trichinella pseudospiralis TaxID=6337 RepID=A0A0V1FXX5_TRIPS|nr:hypothetical protein T4D_1383 [Trichinella pseudospiralis]
MFTDCRFNGPTGKSRPRALFILLNSSNNSNSALKYDLWQLSAKICKTLIGLF